MGFLVQDSDVGVLHLTPPMDTPSYIQQFPLKTKSKAGRIRTTPLVNKKKTTWKWVGEAGAQLPKTPPQVWKPTVGRDLNQSIPMRSEGFVLNCTSGPL